MVGVQPPASGHIFSNGRVVLLLEKIRGAQMALNGTVKKTVPDRGFGFITAEDGEEYFFHRTSVDASIEFDRLGGGERVTFDVERSDKGPRAANVRAPE